MIIYCHNEQHERLLFLDIEFDYNKLVQFSGLLFKKISDNIYQLERSCNQYVNINPSCGFTRYTNLYKSFLENNGTALEDVVQVVVDEFLKDVDLDKVLVISQGLHNDRLILQKNKINLFYNEKTLKNIDGYCTFNNAKRILKRKNKLKLSDLCLECGYYETNKHNAFNDVWSTVAVFTWLKKIEGETDK